MQNKDLFHAVITIMLMVALLWLPPAADARPDPPPPIVAACVVGVIGIACCGVLVYGIYRMCQSIPPDDNPPPANIPPELISTVNLPPNYFRVLPPLTMGKVWEMGVQDLQHADSLAGSARDLRWQTDYSFVLASSDNGTASIIASDCNGNPLMTNTAQIVYCSGQAWAFFNFTELRQTVTNNPPARFFRLVAH